MKSYKENGMEKVATPVHIPQVELQVGELGLQINAVANSLSDLEAKLGMVLRLPSEQEKEKVEVGKEVLSSLVPLAKILSQRNMELTTILANLNRIHKHIELYS